MLYTLMLASRTHRLIERIITTCRTKLDPVILSEPDDRFGIKNDLGDRRKLNNGQLFGGALGGRVKPTRAVKHIAKKVQPHRSGLSRRIDVNNPAPHGIIARLKHGRRLRKAHAHKKRLKTRLVDALTNLGGKRGLPQNLPCRHALHRGVERCQKHKLRRHHMHQTRQCGHASRRHIRIRRHPVIGQTIPPRKGQHRHVGGKELQRRLHNRQPLIVACNMHNGAFMLSDLIQNQACVKPLGGATDRDSLCVRRRGNFWISLSGHLKAPRRV